MIVKLEHDGCGVYILRQGENVVYVGRSGHIPSRLVGHSDKVYDSVEFIFCERSASFELERKLIKEHKPEYNKSFVGLRLRKDAKYKGGKVSMPVKIPLDLHESIKADARKYRISLESISEVMFEMFMALPKAERAKIYEGLPKKVFGRPI